MCAGSWRARGLVQDERGQACIEYALVLIAFAAMVLAMGAVWHASRDGVLLREARDASSHLVGGAGVLGMLRDISLY